MGNPVVFASEDDFKRMVAAVLGQERDRRSLGSPGTTTYGAASHNSAYVKITDTFDANAKGWPGVLTFRNLASNDGSSVDWPTDRPVYAEEINGLDLEVDKRYECKVYGLKTWDEPTEGEVQSMFVLVDAGAAGTSPPPPPPPTSSSGCGWLARVTELDAFLMQVVYADGSCDCIDLTQSFVLTYNGTAWVPDPAFNVPDEFAGCADNFTISFVNAPCDPPCLSLTTTTGGSGETTYNLQFDYCDSTGAGSICFVGAGPVFCADTAEVACARGIFRVCLSCLTIECGSCPDTALPVVVKVVIEGAGGTPSFDFLATYNASASGGGVSVWDATPTVTGCSSASAFRLRCHDETFDFTFTSPGGLGGCNVNGLRGFASTSCDPLMLVSGTISFASAFNYCCGAFFGIDVTFTVMLA